MSRSQIKNLKRAVVKIGTNVLTTQDNRLDTSLIEHLVEQICYLIKKMGKEIIIVTSGAIASGMQILGWKKRPKQINKLQAAASVGQSRLMRVYERIFREEGLNVGQILLTRDIFSLPERRKNVQKTLFTLLKYNIVPIINENDSVAVEEIKFGDNDTLSAFTTELVNADILILLSDVDGLYDRDPKLNRKIKMIHEVKKIGEKIMEIGEKGKPSDNGIGGMKTKIEAARYVTERGKCCIIANGKTPWILKRIFKGERIGTFFHPATEEKNGLEK